MRCVLPWFAHLLNVVLGLPPWLSLGAMQATQTCLLPPACLDVVREQVIDRATGLLVCPVSGRVSDRMMTQAEEEQEEGALQRDERCCSGQPGGQDEDFGGD